MSILEGSKTAWWVLRNKLEKRSGLRTSELDPGIKEYLTGNPDEILKITSEIDQLVQEYNSTQIEPGDSRWKAVTRLKAKIPQLPRLTDMSNEIYSKRGKSRWLSSFSRAAETLNTSMAEAESVKATHLNENLLVLDSNSSALFFGLSKTHPRAKSRALGWHSYEETVFQDQDICSGHNFRKDEINDALIEVLIENHRDPNDPLYSLYRIIRDPESPEQSNAALGWVEGYDHLSDDKLRKAGF